MFCGISGLNTSFLSKICRLKIFYLVKFCWIKVLNTSFLIEKIVAFGDWMIPVKELTKGSFWANP